MERGSQKHQKHPGESSKSAGRKRLAEDVHSEEEEDAEENVEGAQEGANEDLTQRYVDAASQAAKSAVAKSITSEEADKLVSEVMRYVLFKNHQQPDVPVKRDELVQVVTKHYKDRRGLPGYIVQVAQAKFSEIFGLELREMQRSKGVKAANGARTQSQAPQDASVKQYVLRSLLPLEKRRAFVDTPEVAAESGLTAVVLGLIGLAGEKISEDNLFNYLLRLGVKEDEDHPLFGNLEQTLQRMVKQRLIFKEQSNDPGGDTYVYLVAENARNLCPENKLQSFVGELVDGKLRG